jgi:hypothetical protein
VYVLFLPPRLCACLVLFWHNTRLTWLWVKNKP